MARIGGNDGVRMIERRGEELEILTLEEKDKAIEAAFGEGPIHFHVYGGGATLEMKVSALEDNWGFKEGLDVDNISKFDFGHILMEEVYNPHIKNLWRDIAYKCDELIESGKTVDESLRLSLEGVELISQESLCPRPYSPGLEGEGREPNWEQMSKVMTYLNSQPIT